MGRVRCYDSAGSAIDVDLGVETEHIIVPTNGWWVAMRTDPEEHHDEPGLHIPHEHAGKPYASTLTITTDEERHYVDNNAQRLLFGHGPLE